MTAETDNLEPEDLTIEPERVSVWVDDFQKLHARIDDEEFEDIVVRRVFPISRKTDYVSLINDGKEVAMLAHPDKLDKASRKCLDAALDRMYYTAKISRIDSIELIMAVSHWSVMTDRGYARFEIFDRATQVRTRSNGRCLITDVDGNRFVIEDINDLDPDSFKLITTQT